MGRRATERPLFTLKNTSKKTLLTYSGFKDFRFFDSMTSLKTVIAAIVFGSLCGYFLGDHAIYLKPFGDLFLRLIKMVIVPVVFFAILSGITSSGNFDAIKRIGGKALLVYVGTTLCAVCIGFLSGNFLSPGHGIILDNIDKITPPPHHVFDFVANIVPDNALGAMANGNVVQVVFFAIFTGLCMLKLEEASSMIKATQNLAKLVFKMVSAIVKLAPIAAFSFVGWLVGTQGLNIILKLGQLLLTFLFAALVQFGVFALMIFLFKGISPLNFFKKSLAYQAIAISTSSTKASLIPAMKIAEQSLGVSKRSAQFVLPLGASINMDGMAIYFGLCSIFVAQAIGKTLGISDYLTIALTATIGSIGGAGIPSGTMIMLPMVFSSVGLPVEAVALIASVDRIADMIRSMISITGDVAVTVCVDEDFDVEKYNDPLAKI